MNSERTPDIITGLLNSPEPAVRLKVLVNVLSKEPESPEVKQARQEVKASPRVGLLLSERDADGRIPYHPYAKWYGAHWVLATLADIGYPPGDESLIPLREQVYAWLLSAHHERYIKVLDGRVRRCASQEGNAVYALLTLGLADVRADELAKRLMKWQWPDGGWNCDKRPTADTSSFMETLIPLRALGLYARATGDSCAKAACEQAAEVFLKRRLYKRQSDGQVMADEFTVLHYPCYWHYDVLFGLKVMAEAGFIRDERCADALAWLESKRLPDSGFPAEKRYYHGPQNWASGRSLVGWGGTSTKRMNEFITADALSVLKAAAHDLGVPQNQQPL
ncbi:MAG: hypothetical protein IT330_10585 [Anaerolineae bacterium]|nr:hypothetical protein [Anaerolineae bacterium]